ncbi:helix-turn-helix domain-containing protein [Paenibacillus ginsengarvi]|uniref:Helix-turn-helix domain-containing protein n=1 Tax=Paenibacillus ginsengarvi TaxID=400777 RepID=A0A3B0BCW4_9BACL|nr:helix-turn-helix domain-containing protein [Paenibacillus ginsengarvi]RKN70610.1 helix-turn-helix domain-containing protein [Paenibacillus ginsengarvi]
MNLYRIGIRRFHDTTLAKKMWLSVAFVSLLTLTTFAILSSTQIKMLITKREGKVMVQQIEYYTTSINHYFQNIQKSAQVLLYSPDIQEKFSGDMSQLSGSERIRAYNEVYNQLHRMWDNLYGIDAIYLIDRYQNVFKISVEDANMPTFLTGEEFARQGWYDRLGKSDGSSYWSFVKWDDRRASIMMFNAMYNKSDLSLIGHLVISVSPVVFDGFLSALDMGDGTNSIVDSSGIAYTSGRGIASGSPVDLSALTGEEGYTFVERGGEPYMVAYAKNKLTGWTFVHSIPQRIVLKDLKNVNTLWLFFLFVSILLMTVVSAFLLRTITGPLRKLVKLVREVERGKLSGRFRVQYKDELGKLGHAFNHMLDKLEEGIPLIREKLIRSLLERHMSEEELREYERKLDFRFERPFFQVMLLYVREPEPGNENVLQAAETAVRELEQHGGIITDRLAANQFCLILNCPENEALALLEGLMEQLRGECDLTPYAFVGSGYDSIQFVKNSFEEAKTLLKYRISDRMEAEPSVFFTGDAWEHQYPDSFENRMLYYLDEGDFDMCAAVMEELIALIRMKPIAPPVMNTFLTALHNHLNKQLIQFGDEESRLDTDWLGKLDRRLSLEPFEKNGRDFVALARRRLGPLLQKRVKLSPNIERGVHLVREQYGNPNLSVDYAARLLGLNANYFSQLFKKEVGVGFAEYVGGLRMEQAQKLLRETPLKIKEVADKVGFADSHYFGVWFKDNTGLTPSQFRKGSPLKEQLPQTDSPQGRTSVH